MNRWLYVIGGIIVLICSILLFAFAGPFYGFCFLGGIFVAVCSVLIFRTYGQLIMFYFLAGVFVFICLISFLWFMWSYLLIFAAVLFTIIIFLFLGWIRTYETEAENGRSSRQPFKGIATFLIISLIGGIIVVWIIPIIQEKRSVIWPIYSLSKKHKHEAIDMESGNKNEPFALSARREMYLLKREVLKEQTEFIRNKKDRLLKTIKEDREKNPNVFPGILEAEFKDIDVNLQRIAKQTEELDKLINANGKSELIVEKENAKNLIHKAEKFLTQKNDKLTDNQKVDIGNKIIILKDSESKTNAEDIKQDSEELLLALKSAGAPFTNTKDVGVLNAEQKKIFGGFTSIWDNLDAKTIFWIIVVLIIIGNFAGAAFKEAGPRYKGAIKSSVIMFVFALLIYNFIWGNLGKDFGEKLKDVKIPQISFSGGIAQNQWEKIIVELPDVGVYKNISEFIIPCYEYNFKINSNDYMIKYADGADENNMTNVGFKIPSDVKRINPYANKNFNILRKMVEKGRGIEGCG